MSLIPLIKAVLKDLPEPVGFLLAKVPYGWRPRFGRTYATRRREIGRFEGLDIRQRQEFVLQRVRAIVAHAIENVPFYKDLYRERGFRLAHLKRFAGIRDIPVITKSDLKAAPLERRSAPAPGRYVENTGGSTGEPLAFYVLPRLIPHEWAHMHAVWGRLGYRSRHVKITFAGFNTKEKPLAYDGLRHQYSASIYRPFAEVADALARLLRRRAVPYIDGYPSALYDFACSCERSDHEVVPLLQSALRGCFLTSEFPPPEFRRKIDSVFGVPSISWYGHTERAIMAGEKETPWVYHPFQTYGYCETLEAEDGHHLVGTSYDNTASPFIRYDTGDPVAPLDEEDGLLKAFEMRGGREGEFVLDANGERVPLTGLIFGRHHKLFGMVRFLQVRQERPGEATILVTPQGELPSPPAWLDWFDATGVDIDFAFEVLEEPLRTPVGKIKLKV